MEISALSSAIRIVLQLTIKVTKLKASVDYAVMVARVEGGGDGRPTPTIIEIDLVRKKNHEIQSSRRVSGAFHCIPLM